ncbi:hypothetical protein LTR37_011249 [Vermiconidia calcicola]|uniref:Uncharacterized protein n=1 Tax=Vermiconidia calcicola TaxID=1690605 RepID=A0ACC3N2X4_9PEZI|nr:hypothetical protein LTR37_011249 [Vermiconidia calcicola]
MRLIDTSTLQLRNNLDSKSYRYAILSHTWGKRELSLQDFVLQDFVQHQKRHGPGFDKLVQCCRLAREDGIELAWIDTCCIDKTNSVELTEAIQSMFTWYQDAAVCYVFLDDLAGNQHTRAAVTGAELRQCRWFTRGWTLQELLAPWHMTFYNQDFEPVGTKVELSRAIGDVTGIPTRCLWNARKLGECCVAQRMSWISERQTSRPEDIAYCLLGMFDINMPLYYGEGRRKAFLRLQEQIIARSDDESIFAWLCHNTDVNHERRGILAEDPTEFSFSNRGLEISVQRGILPWRRWEANVALNCLMMVPVKNHQIYRLHGRLVETGLHTVSDQETFMLKAMKAGASEQRRVVIRLKRLEVRREITRRDIALMHRIWYRTDLGTCSYSALRTWYLGFGISYENVCVARTHLENDSDTIVVSKFPSFRVVLGNSTLGFFPLLVFLVRWATLIFTGFYSVKKFLEADSLTPGMALFMMAMTWAYLTMAWHYFRHPLG